jgi:glycosyltransferase involved in cell wall biosynthesis
VSGLLVPPAHSGALAQAVVRLLRDAELRAALSEGALARASAFHWDRLAVGVEPAYELARQAPTRRSAML